MIVVLWTLLPLVTLTFFSGIVSTWTFIWQATGFIAKLSQSKALTAFRLKSRFFILSIVIIITVITATNNAIFYAEPDTYSSSGSASNINIPHFTYLKIFDYYKAFFELTIIKFSQLFMEKYLMFKISLLKIRIQPPKWPNSIFIKISGQILIDQSVF